MCEGYRMTTPVKNDVILSVRSNAIYVIANLSFDGMAFKMDLDTSGAVIDRHLILVQPNNCPKKLNRQRSLQVRQVAHPALSRSGIKH